MLSLRERLALARKVLNGEYIPPKLPPPGAIQYTATHAQTVAIQSRCGDAGMDPEQRVALAAGDSFSIDCNEFLLRADFMGEPVLRRRTLAKGVPLEIRLRFTS